MGTNSLWSFAGRHVQFVEDREREEEAERSLLARSGSLPPQAPRTAPESVVRISPPSSSTRTRTFTLFGGISEVT